MRDSSRIIVGLICLLAASGCMVGPDYARPRVPLASNWTTTGDPRLATNAAVDVIWWTSFNDPTLDRLIRLAHRQNLSLQIAALRIREARSQVGVAVGELYPRNPGPIATGAVHGVTESGSHDAFGDGQVGFDAVWELDIWGRYRRGVRSARADFLAQTADYEDAIVSLNAEIARTYVLIRTFEVLIEQALANAALQEEALEIASARYRHGATSELDVAQASALLESTRARIPRLQIGRRQTENALSTLLGRPRGYVTPLLTRTRGIPAPPTTVGVGVPAQLLRRRPDIRAAELRAIAQCNRVGAATAELYPNFVLFGSLGGQLSTVSGGGLDQLFGPGTLFYNLGASVLWHILRYPQIMSNIGVEDARYAQALIEYVRTVLVAAQEVEDGTVGFLLSQETLVFERNAVAAAENAVNLAVIQYREGSADYLRVVDTQRVLLDAQTRLTEALSSTATNAIALYKALGGGWEIAHDRSVNRELRRREIRNRASRRAAARSRNG